MLDLFRMEAETQAQVLTAGLLALERDRDPPPSSSRRACARPTRSKGAARIVGLAVGVRVAHAMEDCFVAAQEGRIALAPRANRPAARGHRPAGADRQHAGSGSDQWAGGRSPEVERLRRGARARSRAASPPRRSRSPAADRRAHAVCRTPANRRSPWAERNSDRVLRVTAENLNRLLGLAGESLVESRWVKPFADSLLRLKRLQHESRKTLDTPARSAVGARSGRARRKRRSPTRSGVLSECQQFLAAAARRARDVRPALHQPGASALRRGARLPHEAVRRRRSGVSAHGARPGALARQAGEAGDRRRGDAGGSRHPGEARRAARPSAAQRHRSRHRDRRRSAAPRASPRRASSGSKPVTAPARCTIIVSDDGRGVDLEKLREAVVERNLHRREAAAALSEAELLEFLFLPGFTMKDDRHRHFRPRRRPRRRAGHGQAGARHRARVVAGRQGHALPAAAAGHALGRPHAAGGDRRRAVRLSARVTSSARSSCRRTRSSCSKAASISTSTDGGSGS